MKIILSFTGSLKDFLAKDTFELKLKEEATIEDLYDALGELIPQYTDSTLWNPKKNRFRGPIIISSDSKIIKDVNTKLTNGQHLQIKRFLIGG